MPILNWLGREEAIETANKTPYKLLEEVPDLGYGDKNTENMIIQGDNLEALKALLPFYAGQVKCIYIDPPYNTGNAFEHYDDNLEHSIWLSLMYPRLELLKEFLRDDGFIFVQIDDNEQAYLKVIMDEIFGRNNFVNCISVNMSNMSGPKVQHAINGLRFPKIKEYILLYAKSNTRKLRIPKVNKNHWDEEYNIYIPELTIEIFNEIKQLQDKEDIKGLNEIAKSFSLISRKEMEKNISKKDVEIWRYENAYRIFASKPNIALSKKAFEMCFENPVAFITNPTGMIKMIKTDFNRKSETQRIELCNAKEHQEMFLGDSWDDIVTTGGTAKEGKIEFKASKKPEKLIERIINCCSSCNDIVMDSFLGSGTTVAVAQKLGRRYIGIEIGDHAITHCVPRLKDVIDGEQSGISKFVNWKGGGGFRFYKLGDEIFDAEGCINENISFENLSAHIWFTETKTPFNKPKSKSTYLGNYDGKDYALLYNGILKDKKVDGGNVLTNKTLNVILEDMENKPYDKLIIYGESSRISEARLKNLNIEFKQTPYDIKAR